MYLKIVVFINIFKMLLSFNDICLIPAVVSEIEHRSECNPYINEDLGLPMPLRLGCLPLFTAPMSSVINENNWQVFKENKINTIIPRSVDWETRLDLSDKTFIAVSLSEFEEIVKYVDFSDCRYICIDIANGHMKKLLDVCKKAKNVFGNRIQIMAGNIANPDTYYEYAKAGIDYVRVGIGTGSACTTSSNVGGIHYPMVSLLSKLKDNKQLVTSKIALSDCCYSNEKCEFNSIPKIIADGGFSNFDQIIKALAIGADYVMLGKIFAMSEEACGEIVYKDQIIPTKMDLTAFNDDERSVFEAAGFDKVYINKTIQVPYRKYYGMSTKRAQTEISGEATKTAEGIETLVPIKYTLAGWCDNFISYLRSAMSYCNSRNLQEFRKNAHVEQISANSFNAYYK